MDSLQAVEFRRILCSQVHHVQYTFINQYGATGKLLLLICSYNIYQASFLLNSNHSHSLFRWILPLTKH